MSSLCMLVLGPMCSASAEIGFDWKEVITSSSWYGRRQHTSVVYDEKIWVLGASSKKNVLFSSDGVNWSEATSSTAPWAWRDGHTSVIHNGRIWIIGGNYKNDVWHSADGSSWTEATSSAPWAGRNGHSSIVYEGKIWVIGGRDTLDIVRNDVWYSQDGTSWTQATGSAPWVPRNSHTSVVYDGKIWVLGGDYFDTSSYYSLNDVWYSSDGATWTSATLSADWSARAGHTSVVHNGKMWLVGGGDSASEKNDVWYSSDGTSWTRTTTAAPWSPRFEHTSVVYSGKIWVIMNDVWCSPDGVNWTQTAPAIPKWSERWGHAAVVHNGKIWVFGGEGFPGNDVWYSPDGANWTEAVFWADWEPRLEHVSVVYWGKIWILGGRDDMFFRQYNDVWYSVNGREWTSATLAAPWAARYGHASAVYDGKIWVLGGAYYEGATEYVLNDVWSSPDGTSWTLETAAAPWPAQWGHAAVVLNGDLYLIGRHIEYLPPPMDSLYVGDVWRYDGAAWTRTTDWAPWQARTGHTVVSCDGRMWLMGGCIQVIYWDEKINDVWSSPDGVNWTFAGLADWSIRDEHASVVFQDRIWVLGGLENGGRWTSPIPRNDIWYSARETPARRWQRYR